MSVGVGRGRWFSNAIQSNSNEEKGVGSGFGMNNDHSIGDNGHEKPDASTPNDSGWDETPSNEPSTEWGGGGGGGDENKANEDGNKANKGRWNNGQDRGGFVNRGRGGGRGGRGGYQNRDENFGGGGRSGYRNRDENDGGGGRSGYRNRDENDEGESRHNRSGDYQNGQHGYRGGRGGGDRRGRNGEDNDGESSNWSRSNRDDQRNGGRTFRGRGGGYRNNDDNHGDSGDKNWSKGDGGSSENRDDSSLTDRNWGGFGDNNDDQDGRGHRGRGRGGGGRGGRGGFGRGGGHGNDNDTPYEGGFKSRNDGTGDDSEDCDKPKVPAYIPPPLPEDEASIFAPSIPSGINFSKLENSPVKMTGNNVPVPISSFEDSGLRPLLKENVRKAGYATPTPVQKYSIPAILANRDLMSCAQTGSGKTAAFLLPLLHNLMEANVESGSFEEAQSPYVLIVSPTRELTKQIYQEAYKFAYGSVIKMVVLYGGVVTGHQLRKLQQGCHICVATPGRLLDIVEKGKINFSKLQYLVLDEADRMLDMGFKPAIEQIVRHPSMQPKEKRNTLMFSATFPEEIQHMAREYLEDYLFLTVGQVGGANSDVNQEIVLVQAYEKRDKLLEIIAGGKRILVFIEQKRQADFVSSIICQSPGLSATSIHGDRFQQQREEALDDFKNGKRQVLVATSVASRGLDIKDVEHVINYDMPKDITEYVHRIGRTGRVGNPGRATSFYNPETDKDLAKPLLKVLADANQEVPAWLEEEAKNSFGGGSSFTRGRFGGCDIRSNKEIRGNADPPEVDQWNNDKGVQESESWD